MPTLSDYLQTAMTVAGSTVTTPWAGKWVRLVNNITATAYVSTAATDANGLFTVPNVPAGIYTVYTGPTSGGAWSATGDASYVVGPGSDLYIEVVLLGDGSDEGPAINTAIASANSQGGGTVTLKGGKTASIATTIVPMSGVTLDMNGSTLKWTGATSTPMVLSNPGAGSNVDHFWTKNGVFDAQNAVGVTQLDLRSWQYGGLDNIWLKNGALTGGVTPALRLGAVSGTDFKNNTVGNQLRNVRISTCQVGLQLDGILANGPAATDNTFVGLFIDDLYQTGIRFVQYCDSNLFYGVRIGFHANGAGLTNNAGIIVNDSATPAADVGVYDEQFYGLFIDAPSGPASQKAIVLNWQRQCHIEGVWTSIGTTGGSLGTTVQDNNSQSHFVEILAANSGTPYQSQCYVKNYVFGSLAVVGGAGGGLDTQTATFLPIGQINANGVVIYPGLSLNSVVSKVNNIATAGLGVPAIYQSAIFTAQTAAKSPVATLTSPNDGAKHIYEITGTVTITTLGSGNINLEVTYTDDNGTARTCIIPLCAEAGTFATAANTADAWKGGINIAVNPNTAITILTAGTFTGCTYNVSGQIQQIA